jgi:hypothetical protein
MELKLDIDRSEDITVDECPVIDIPLRPSRWSYLAATVCSL